MREVRIRRFIRPSVVLYRVEFVRVRVDKHNVLETKMLVKM